ncbi:3-OXO-5-ALPHA-STEROID 4-DEHYDROGENASE FAMILY PROTEIN [Salix koriyanagi]|uniref:3-OXO-5-ALPHA-STEROID 4-DEHYDROGENASE FAMILY PROTEIN n=1 Tax=Salix koriyanagi TaxID=2511006 RepID=A0A9Q0WHW8_9ROSI|nr:3-OXO-5-ALPHA-STEROID 4-DEHYDROGENASE FAMILY PROTEIN [Salix koriyanagi]
MLSRVIFPPPNSLFITVMSMASLSFSVLGLCEGLGKNFEYSKFSNLNVEKSTSKQNNAVCSRNGMLAAYLPAFLSAVTFSGLFPNVGLRFLLVNSALTMHFFKRILEVLFVHKYSGGMAGGTVITITLGYFTTTSITIYALGLTQGFPEPPVDLKYLGVVLFLVGIVGNFYHHLLLASLRTKIDKGYKVPKGGLFGLVACPHYFFEILSFLGICFISQTLYSFASTISTICYLMGRSYATRRWYLTKFDDFPKDVKAIIPYVF